MKTNEEKSTVKTPKGADKKEWLQELASLSLFSLTDGLVKLFFNENPDPESWLSNKSPVLYQKSHRLPYFLDVAYRVGNISMGLYMDTSRKPDMDALWDYSTAMIVYRHPTPPTDGEDPKRSLYVCITEHSYLKEKWFYKMKWRCMDMPSEDNTYEDCPTGPNILIIDLENFQKQVTAPEGFLEQFLKILAESRTLDEAKNALNTVLEMQCQVLPDQLARMKKEAKIDNAQQS